MAQQNATSSSSALADQPNPTLIPISEENSRQVTDADEEIFLLYTLSPPAVGQYGLGYLNNSHDLLSISLDLDSKSTSSPLVETLDQDHHQPQQQASSKSKHSAKTAKFVANRKKKEPNREDSNLQVTLHQDVSLFCLTIPRKTLVNFSLCL